MAALRMFNVAFANLLVIAHAGLLAYLATAWSMERWVKPWASTGSWLAVAGVGILLSGLFGAVLGGFMWVANRFALRPMNLHRRLLWSRRLGWATFIGVLVGGTAGSVELFVHRPVPLTMDVPVFVRAPAR